MPDKAGLSAEFAIGVYAVYAVLAYGKGGVFVRRERHCFDGACARFLLGKSRFSGTEAGF